MRRASAVLCALCCAAVAALARTEALSPAARALREGTPFAGLVTLRAPGQGRVVPPAVFILIRERPGALDILHAPPGRPAGPAPGSASLAEVYARAYEAGGDPAKAGRTMALAAAATLTGQRTWPPGASPEPLFWIEVESTASPSPEGLKRLLLKSVRDPLFWPRAALPTPRALRLHGLSRYDAWSLAWAAHRLRPASIRPGVLPGSEDAAAFLARRRGPAGAAPPATVEVLNATGAPGVALKATKVLRLRGIDVIHFGNTPGLGPTRFVDHVGRPEGAEPVRSALGCPPSEVVAELESAPRASVTVTLGQDYGVCAALKD